MDRLTIPAGTFALLYEDSLQAQQQPAQPNQALIDLVWLWKVEASHRLAVNASQDGLHARVSAHYDILQVYAILASIMYQYLVQHRSIFHWQVS